MDVNQLEKKMEHGLETGNIWLSIHWFFDLSSWVGTFFSFLHVYNGSNNL